MNRKSHRNSRHRSQPYNLSQCRLCGSHNTRKVSLLYEADTHQTFTRGHYTTTGSHPGVGTYRGTHLSESLLAQRLAPPEDKQPGNGYYAIPILFAVGFIAAILVTTIRAFVFIDTQAERSLPYLYTVAVAGFPIVLLWAVYRAQRVNQEYYQQVYLPGTSNNSLCGRSGSQMRRRTMMC